MELDLVIGTIRTGIKSTIEMHILIFIILFFALFLTFYPKNPKRPNGQSANMAYSVAFFISFQKIIPSKIPPRGGGNRGYWWLKDYHCLFTVSQMFLFLIYNAHIVYFWCVLMAFLNAFVDGPAIRSLLTSHTIE